MEKEIKAGITKLLNDWYEEPNWVAGDFPILADQICQLFEGYVKLPPDSAILTGISKLRECLDSQVE